MKATTNRTRPRTGARQWALRALYLVGISVAVGWFMHQVSHRLERGTEPAGFGRGVVQGALMPMALPNLLIGKDVPIYAANNTGVGYKLGYTVGVNTCGAIFFGLVHSRVRRRREQNQQTKDAAG